MSDNSDDVSGLITPQYYQPKPEHIGEFVSALIKVYSPDNPVDMTKSRSGTCDSPGCFGWLARKALNHIGKHRQSSQVVVDLMKSCYFTLFSRVIPAKRFFCAYEYELARLAYFLHTGEILLPKQITDDEIYQWYSALKTFAKEHPDWWGNDYGAYLGAADGAFLSRKILEKHDYFNINYQLKEYHIVDWWIAIERREVPTNTTPLSLTLMELIMIVVNGAKQAAVKPGETVGETDDFISIRDYSGGNLRIYKHPPTFDCPFQIGDKVIFTNDYGVEFAGLEVVGFDYQIPDDGRYIYIDYSDSPRSGAWWFAHSESELRKRQTSILSTDI